MIEQHQPAPAETLPLATPFDAFRSQIEATLAAGTLSSDVIGKGLTVDGPLGPVPMIYADYAASGRALKQVEQFILDQVLPVYANPHTQASYCGRSINALRKAARCEVADYCDADDEDAVIFAGSGATAGLQKLVRLLGADLPDETGGKPLVLHGPYEHHSNLLPWRESGAEVVELPEGENGGVDREVLERHLAAASGRRIIATFSAGSNVTGVLTDIVGVSRQVKAHGGAVIWDFAGAAPYLSMSMRPAADVHIDALVCSPHKFIGGPGASGILVVRKDAVILDRPSAAGGGTVSFVSPENHVYLADLTAREEAGTPNAIGDIRAALTLIVGGCLMRAGGDQKTAEMRSKALAAWRGNSRIEILGPNYENALPIISFRVRDGHGDIVHHQLFTRILSDCFGIQARGGCACAGPYVHRLLGISRHGSEAIQRALELGHELEKPGFVRINFSPLMDETEFRAIVEAVNSAARDGEMLSTRFAPNPATAVFEPIEPLSAA